MIVDKINQYLSEKDLTIDEGLRYEIEKLSGWSFQQKFMQTDSKDSTGRIYVSQIGKCPRQIAYQYHGIEKAGKEIDGRALFNFWFGDLIELATASLAKLAFQKLGGGSLKATGFDQTHIEIPVNGAVISGYPDGLLITGKEFVNVEVKSMPSYSFKRFEKGDINEDYISQIQAEMAGLGVEKTCMVAVCKDNGVFNERIIDFNGMIHNKNLDNIKTVLDSTPEELPEPRYQSNDKGEYPWQCLYCGWWQACHENAEKVLKSKRYILKEKTDGKAK